MSDKRVYLDWAATTPLSEEAYEAMIPFLQPGLAEWESNANSLHTEGRRAHSALEQSRAALAATINARADEVFFTSGATESDVWAIKALSALGAKKRRIENPHIITTRIEHEAVLEPCKQLKAQGYRITELEPDKNGFISPDNLKQALSDETVLVSIMLANNEIGSIEPVKELARIAHEHGVYFHTDATQALGKIPVDVRDLDIDAMSMSSHKLCGPKGVGALFVRAGVNIEPLLAGGGQESGMRSGTQNVCGIVGFAAAAVALDQTSAFGQSEHKRLRELRDYLYERLCAYDLVHPTVQVPQDSEDFLPNIVSICVKGIESETLILRFDMLGFDVSAGSACSSHSLEPSRVLKAIKMDRDLAFCSLRISFGRYTTKEELDSFVDALDKVINWNPALYL